MLEEKLQHPTAIDSPRKACDLQTHTQPPQFALQLDMELSLADTIGELS